MAKARGLKNWYNRRAKHLSPSPANRMRCDWVGIRRNGIQKRFASFMEVFCLRSFCSSIPPCSRQGNFGERKYKGEEDELGAVVPESFDVNRSTAVFPYAVAAESTMPVFISDDGTGAGLLIIRY